MNRYLMFWYFFVKFCFTKFIMPILSLQWRHNGLDGVWNHQPHYCLLSRLFGRRSKKTSKLRVTGLCAGNSTGTGEFSAQVSSNAENASIWWLHHVSFLKLGKCVASVDWISNKNSLTLVWRKTGLYFLLWRYDLVILGIIGSIFSS